MVRTRVRIRFCKRGDLRWIGHRDLMRCLERLFRRARLPLGMSQGFHPRPRMTFPLALAVAVEGTDEVMELELTESATGEALLARLSPHVLRGLTLKSVEVLPPGSKKAQARSAVYQVPIPAPCRPGLSKRIDRLMAASSYPIRRPQRTAPIDLRALLAELSLRKGVLSMRLRIGAKGSVRPGEVLRALGLAEGELHGVHLTRTAVEVS